MKGHDGMPIQVRVGRSRIAGTGVFAAQFIKKSTWVLEYTGEKISRQEATQRLAQGPNQQSFSEPRNTLQQHVAVGHQRKQDSIDDLLLAYDHPGDFRPQRVKLGDVILNPLFDLAECLHVCQ